MLGLLLMFSLEMAAPIPGRSDPQIGPAAGEASRQTVSQAEAAAAQLAAEAPEVARTYEELVVLDKRDRMKAYADLPSSMKCAIWTHQFLVALSQHPEFTEEQRGVLYDAIELLKPEWFDIHYPSPAWSTRVDQPLPLNGTAPPACDRGSRPRRISMSVGSHPVNR